MWKYFSITIDITEITFLAFLEECQQHYCLSLTDRDDNSIQFRFQSRYGTTSLTFYATISHQLVLGASYFWGSMSITWLSSAWKQGRCTRTSANADHWPHAIASAWIGSRTKLGKSNVIYSTPRLTIHGCLLALTLQTPELRHRTSCPPALHVPMQFVTPICSSRQSRSPQSPHP